MSESLNAFRASASRIGYDGATAVQILTGFLYEGPCAVKRINRGLLRLMERDGFKNISEAVGAGARA